MWLKPKAHKRGSFLLLTEDMRGQAEAQLRKHKTDCPGGLLAPGGVRWYQWQGSLPVKTSAVVSQGPTMGQKSMGSEFGAEWTLRRSMEWGSFVAGDPGEQICSVASTGG